MRMLNQWAGLRNGEVAGLHWSDVTTTDRLVKDEIRLLPNMTKGRHARIVFVSVKLKAEMQALLHKPFAWPAATSESDDYTSLLIL